MLKAIGRKIDNMDLTDMAFVIIELGLLLTFILMIAALAKAVFFDNSGDNAKENVIYQIECNGVYFESDSVKYISNRIEFIEDNVTYYCNNYLIAEKPRESKLQF